MILKIFGTMLLCAALSFSADSVSLSGIVTKTEGGGALKDANVTTTFFRDYIAAIQRKAIVWGKFYCQRTAHRQWENLKFPRNPASICFKK